MDNILAGGTPQFTYDSMGILSLNGEPIHFRMEIDVAPFKMVTMLQDHNEEIKARVEEGCKQAVEYLKATNVIEDLVKKEVVASITRSIGDYGWVWEIEKQAKETIKKALDEVIQQHTAKIIEAALKSINKQK